MSVNYISENPTIYAEYTESLVRNANKSIPLWQHLITFPVSSHVVVGLAKIFNFEVLTHGTSFKNHINILKTGADPSRGGSKDGSTEIYVGQDNWDKEFQERTKGYFYVFKDVEIRRATRYELPGKDANDPYIYVDKKSGKIYKEQLYRSLTLIEKIQVYIFPRKHAALSGAAQVSSDKSTIKKIFYGLANFLFSPTLRFIYTSDETKKLFIDDPDYDGRAYRTSYHLPNNRIGLIAVFSQASLNHLKEGIAKRPLRVLIGVIQCFAGMILTVSGVGLIT